MAAVMIEVHYSSSTWQDRLGVGFIGSGFMTRFHIRSWEAVRDADIRGIYSPDPRQRRRAPPRWPDRFTSATRRPSARSRRWSPTSRSTASGCAARTSRASRTWSASSPRSRRARSCAPSPARSRSAATPPRPTRMVELVEEAGVLHGYLENQLFQPSLERGKQIVWARGAAASGRPVSRARGRRARRSAHAVVLAGRSAGRRRAQRHDVPQPRGRPLPADQARARRATASGRSRCRRRSLR